MIDLLELGGLSWAAYMENLPNDGFNGASYVQPHMLIGIL
jgi:hypothetical protein